MGSAAGGNPGNWLQLQMQPLAHWREEDSPELKLDHPRPPEMLLETARGGIVTQPGEPGWAGAVRALLPN